MENLIYKKPQQKEETVKHLPFEGIEADKLTIGKALRELSIFPRKGKQGGLYINGEPAPFEKWEER